MVVVGEEVVTVVVAVVGEVVVTVDWVADVVVTELV